MSGNYILQSYILGELTEDWVIGGETGESCVHGSKIELQLT